MKQTIGTCSLCGGPVSVPVGPWGSVIPPKPTCEGCGAVAAEHGPVVPMVRPAPHSNFPGLTDRIVIGDSAGNAQTITEWDGVPQTPRVRW